MTVQIDVTRIYNEIVDRLTDNGEEDANKQAADAVQEILDMEDKLEEEKK